MQNECNIYDVIVVGAGIEGSATAYNLAKNGKRTMLLEQFTLPHEHGSSHGKSRITRRNYGARNEYAEMMKEAFDLTKELESECGEQLFINCEYIEYGPKGGVVVTEAENCLKACNVPYEKFDVNEQRKRYPHFMLPDNYEFLLEKTGGFLKADKMLQSFQGGFTKHGGILMDNETLLDLAHGDIVSVKTTKFIHKTRSVVLTLGAWAAKFLPRIGINVPLQPERITVCYWKHKNNYNRFNHENYPTFFTRTAADKYTIYGVPEYDYPDLVKNSPDKGFILDVHPKWKNFVIGAGFSGHGFKLSPVVGKLLSQLATGQRTSYDLSPFRLGRFLKNKL